MCRGLISVFAKSEPANYKNKKMQEINVRQIFNLHALHQHFLSHEKASYVLKRYDHLTKCDAIVGGSINVHNSGTKFK